MHRKGKQEINVKEVLVSCFCRQAGLTVSTQSGSGCIWPPSPGLSTRVCAGEMLIPGPREVLVQGGYHLPVAHSKHYSANSKPQMSEDDTDVAWRLWAYLQFLRGRCDCIFVCS